MPMGNKWRLSIGSKLLWIVNIFNQKTSAQLMEKCLEVGRMLGGMMEKAEMFCGEPPHTLREGSAIYFKESGDEDADA